RRNRRDGRVLQGRYRLGRGVLRSADVVVYSGSRGDPRTFWPGVSRGCTVPADFGRGPACEHSHRPGWIDLEYERVDASPILELEFGSGSAIRRCDPPRTSLWLYGGGRSEYVGGGRC